MKSHQRVTSSTLLYGRPPVTGAPPPESRICVAAGCATKLSRYNPVDTCSRHGGWGRPRPVR